MIELALMLAMIAPVESKPGQLPTPMQNGFWTILRHLIVWILRALYWM